jgi:Rieske Fe-S protein
MMIARWSRRQFMAMTGAGALGASATLLLGACTAKQEEAPASPPAASAPAADDPFAGIAAGQGAVVDVDGAKIAAYRTEAGELIRLVADCPHQGCPVEWNAGQSRWVCPCHMSAFEPDGTFVSGPADSDLSEVS